MAKSMITVQSRAHRALRRLAGYEPAVGSRLPFPAPTEPLAQEELMGIYRNNSTDVDSVLFTTEAVYLRRDDSCVRLLRYCELDKIVSPTSKSDVKGLGIRLRDGAVVWLPIGGSRDGRTFDAFAVWRFLDRVRDDLAGRSSDRVRTKPRSQSLDGIRDK